MSTAVRIDITASNKLTQQVRDMEKDRGQMIAVCTLHDWEPQLIVRSEPSPDLKSLCQG